jgi:hypothetical protein
MVNTINNSLPITHRADAPGFRYIGRWHPGCPAVTICSGAILEFVFPGLCCELFFDVAGMTQFPDLMIQVDDGPLTRYRLDATNTSIKLNPENLPESAKGYTGYWHMVRCWTIIASADPNQWATQNGGCKFLGVRCDSREAVLPTLPVPTATIEFLGDSITQSLRLLYTGLDGWDTRDPQTGLIHEWRSSLDHQHPVLNWPWQAARLLGMYPIVTGFGGQGLINTGTIGAPPGVKAFPYAYADTPWHPPVEPKAVVIYHGTNDGEFGHDLYLDYLKMIRAAYPNADIFAVCPHPKANLVAPISQAAKIAGDRVHFFDYSNGVIDTPDTSDGCHLNPSGAMHLAVRLANDISRTINTTRKPL